jgi:hypothetical protein
MQVLLPDSSQRSPTAVRGKSDMRDDNVYSAITLQHGGQGQQSLFANPRGQAIPFLRGGAVTVATSAHQVTYTEQTTNISQAGQLGAAIGDASFVGFGATIENGYYVAASGALNAYGAGQQEVSEILNKVFFQMKTAGKKQIEGPLFLFPTAGGQTGSISTTANASTVATSNNGAPGNIRRLKLPILVARQDTLEGIVGVAGGDSLTFSVTTGVGQPTLVWITIRALIASDAR